MAEGKYSSYPPRRRRRRRRNPAGPIIVILLLIALLAIIGTVMLHSCQSAPEVPETQPAPEAALPKAPEPTEEVITVPATEPQTEEPTEETTEETTEPTTEPTEATEETTEETTEATTEPTTEPTVKVTEPPTEQEKAVGQQIADLAKAQIGKPYGLGGVGPEEFDTSGFVIYCVKEATGTSLPHSVSMQGNKGDRVEKKDLLPGDVVFFWTSDPESVEYVGIYTGGGKFVAARNPEKPVSELGLNTSYFKERYLFACRYW